MKKLFLILFSFPFLFSAQLDSTCYLIPDIGPCFGSITKYYYDQTSAICMDFIWGGCDGVVPFHTMQDCQSACMGTNSIQEYKRNRKLNRIVDILGQPAREDRNTLLLYVYDDGSVEKKIISP